MSSAKLPSGKGAIDYWANIFTPEAMKKYVIDNPELGPVFSASERMRRAARGISVQDWVMSMNAANVDITFVPASRFKSYMHGVMAWDVPTEEVADIIAEAPTRFRGLAGINPETKMRGVKELERAVTQFGFVGAHIHAFGYNLPLNDRAWYPFYAKCVELDVPVVLQAGHSGEMMPSHCGRPILLDDVALYFPDLKIVASHHGWPWTEELIALAGKHPNIYIGAGAYGPRYWQPNIVQFLKHRGRNKVLFGSDWPVLWYENVFDDIEELGIEGDLAEGFYRGNAVRVFKLESRSDSPK